MAVEYYTIFYITYAYRLVQALLTQTVQYDTATILGRSYHGIV